MRYRYIDIVKGMGIMMVVYAHLLGQHNKLELYATSCSVQIFFVLAGYLYKDKTIKAHFQSRWKRLIIPYFIYSFVLFFLNFLFNGIELEQSGVGIIGILYSAYCLYYPVGTENNLYFYQFNNAPLWFLTALFTSDILFFILEKYLNNKKVEERRRYKIIILLGCMLVSGLMTKLPVFLPWSLDKMFIGAVLMIVGKELRDRKVFENLWTGKSIFSMCVMCILYVMSLSINPNVNISIRYYGDSKIFGTVFTVVSGALGTWICVEIAKILQSTCIGKILENLGKHTISVLALHLEVAYIYNLYVAKYIKIGQETYIRRLFDVCIVISIIVVGVVMVEILRKNIYEIILKYKLKRDQL